MKKRIYFALVSIFMLGALTLSGCAGKTVSSSSDGEPEVSVSDEKTETVSSEDVTVSKEEPAPEPEPEKEPDPDAKPEGIENIVIKKQPLPDSEAVAFVMDMGAGFNLGNTFDAYNDSKNVKGTKLETYWGNPVTTKENIQGLKAAGFNTIRIPVSWHNHVDEKFNIDEAWMDRVEEVVKWALDEDMYVILNIHHDDDVNFVFPSYDKLASSKKYVTAIWKQVAARFGDYNEKLIFESLNEPRQKDTPQEWYVDVNSEIGKECIDCINQLNQAAVDAIRSTEGEYNKKRYITVPGYAASPDFILSGGFALPDDSQAEFENRILITVHAYRPYKFALEPSGVKVFKVTGGGEELKTLFTQLYIKYVKQGTGIIIDEFGSVDRGNKEYRVTHAACFTAYARAYGMSVCWWDNGNFSGSGEIFGIYKRTTNEITQPEIVNQIIYYSNN